MVMLKLFCEECNLYEYLASRLVGRILTFFESGQEAIMRDVTEACPSMDDEGLNQWIDWNDLKEKIEDIEKPLEVCVAAE
jgi:hypothetical protein